MANLLVTDWTKVTPAWCVVSRFTPTIGTGERTSGGRDDARRAEPVGRESQRQGAEADKGARSAASLQFPVRLGLTHPAVDDEAEIAAAEREPGRVPEHRRGIVGDGDEGASHALGPGADRLECLGPGDRRNEAEDRGDGEGGQRNPEHHAQLIVPSPQAVRSLSLS